MSIFLPGETALLRLFIVSSLSFQVSKGVILASVGILIYKFVIVASANSFWRFNLFSSTPSSSMQHMGER